MVFVLIYIILFSTLSEAYIDLVRSKIASLDEVSQQEILDIISESEFTDQNLRKYPFLNDYLKDREMDKPKGLSSLFFSGEKEKKFDYMQMKEKMADIITMCQFSLSDCLKELVDGLFEQVQLFIQEYMSIQLLMFIVFEVSYYLFNYYLEVDLFKMFVRNHDKETSQFKVYKASKIRTYIYFISKFSVIICKITMIYYVVETFFIFVLSIFSAIAYVIYYCFFWSFYDLVLNKRRRFKSRKNVVLNRRKTLAFREIGSTYNSDLIDIYLLKIFNSNVNSDELVRDINLNVLGSLTDYARHYQYLNFEARGVFNVNDRSKNYQQWTDDEKQVIRDNLNRYRYNLINYKTVTNNEFIMSVAKIIIYLVPIVAQRRDLRLVTNVESKDKFVSKIRNSCDKYVDAYRYDYFQDYILLRRVYYVTNLIFDITFLNRNLSQIQVYSNVVNTTAQLASKIKGRILIKSKESERLISKLKQLNSELVYESSETEIEHSFSHYISKVMHMTVINDHLEVDTYNKLLDVGSSFCDLQLGNGVSYCIADIEEQDGRRTVNYYSRIKDYVTKNLNHCLTIYNGDVNDFNFKNTEVTRFVIHNACYNIDLVDLLDTASRSNVEYIVNSVQVPINVLHGLDSESIDNEMKWSITEGIESKSNLTKSSYYLKGSTKIDLYPHSLAIFIDWFKRCSVLIHYNNEDVNWNSNVTRATLGYYNFIWCPSKVRKMEGILKNNDEYTDTISIKDEPGYYTIVMLPRHNRFTTLDSILNTAKEFKNKSSIEEVATKLLETRISKQTLTINVAQDTDLEILSRIRNNNCLIIKSDRDNYLQISAEVSVNASLELNTERFVNAKSCVEFKIMDAISSLERQDIQGFIDKINEADNDIYIKIDDKYYYLNEREENVAMNLDRYYVTIDNNGIMYNKVKNKILNDLQYIKLQSVSMLHNLIVKTLKPDKNKGVDESLTTQKLEQYLKKTKGKQLGAIFMDVARRKICVMKQLISYYEQHQRKIVNRNTYDYNSKQYICDSDNDASVNEVDEAIQTGYLADEHINCIIYLDYVKNQYYVSKPVAVINDNKLNLTTNMVRCDYHKYDYCYDETDERQTRVTSEKLKPLIKIIMDNGEVIYTTDLYLATHLRFSRQPDELALIDVYDFMF